MPDKILLRHKQQDGWMRLMAMCSELSYALPDVESWFKDVGIWGQVKRADGLLVSALRKSAKCIDDKQYAALAAKLRNYTVTIGTKPISTHNDLCVVTADELNTICDYIASDTCAMCMLDNNEQRKCELRRALEGLPNHVKDSNTGGCPFAICERE